MSLVTPAKIDPNAASDLLLRVNVAKRDVSKLLPEVRDAAIAVRRALGVSRDKVMEATGQHVTVTRLSQFETDKPALPTLDEAVALARWMADAAGCDPEPAGPAQGKPTPAAGQLTEAKDSPVATNDVEALPDLPDAT